jgi:hypothetical protein
MTTSIMISCPATFHGNLHPKYGSVKDGKYTTACTITSILDFEIDKSVNVTYSTDDINWLGDFWFRDYQTRNDLVCYLDRWYSFKTHIVGGKDGNFVLSDIHIVSVDNDTSIGLARKRRSLRLGEAVN